MNLMEIRKAINNPKNVSKEVDSSKFNDDVASKTDWHLMRFIGLKNYDNKLDDSESGKINIIPTNFAKLFLFFGVLTSGLVMTIATLATLAIGMMLLFPGNSSIHADIRALTVGIGISILSITFYIFLYKSFRKSKLIKSVDKIIGYYYLGKHVESVEDVVKTKEYHEIDRIYAIQLLGNGRSFEINLIFNDASRAYLLTQSYYQKALKIGKRLSEFLDVPLWDGA